VTEIDVARDAFDRRFWMQLKRQPREFDLAFTLELVDSNRVDVAPRSNVVREDHEVHSWHLDSSKHLLICRWQNGREGEGAPASALGKFRR
jgi:hypothetical protein